MLTGMGARRQPLVLIITTAGANIEGPCYDKRRQVIEMLEGTVPDDELFGWIFTIDEGDDWTNPEVLVKANPNMGISVYREYLESQQQKAIRSARFTNTFKTKHLNVWTSAKTGFYNLEKWRACEDTTLTLEQFEGQSCNLGFRPCAQAGHEQHGASVHARHRRQAALLQRRPEVLGARGHRPQRRQQAHGRAVPGMGE
jgi:phage terminase large subunit-like protein